MALLQRRRIILRSLQIIAIQYPLYNISYTKCGCRALLYGSFAKETYNFEEPTISYTVHSQEKDPHIADVGIGLF